MGDISLLKELDLISNMSSINIAPLCGSEASVSKAPGGAGVQVPVSRTGPPAGLWKNA
jgi:hypothetical protein